MILSSISKFYLKSEFVSGQDRLCSLTYMKENLAHGCIITRQHVVYIHVDFLPVCGWQGMSLVSFTHNFHLVVINITPNDRFVQILIETIL